MTRATLLTSILVFVVLAAAGGEVCRGDPPVASDMGPSQAHPTNSKPVYHPRVAEYWNSDCLTDGNGDPYWPCGEDEIEFAVAPNTLYVVHENAAYNCCLDEIVISLSAEGDVLRLTEEEILTNPCYCVCCYEATATIVDLAPGPYTVEFWWYDYDTHEHRCYVEEIVIPGGGPQPDGGEPPVPDDLGDCQLAPADLGPLEPRVEEYFNSGCLGEGDGGDWNECEDDDEIELTVEVNTLHVLHANATYNCCPDDIVISLEVEENLLRLTEEEILTDPCFCVCCYEVTATIIDLAPGPYTVEFWWYDYDTHEHRCYVEEIVIPGDGPQPDGGEAPVVTDLDGTPAGPIDSKPLTRPQRPDYWHSECLDMDYDPDWWPCEGDDEIILSVKGNTLHTRHENATYNCCPDDIVISAEVEENLILLTEEEILTNPCDCICCYEANAIVADLAPGEYIVEFCWFDYQTGEERCHIEEIVIP